MSEYKLSPADKFNIFNITEPAESNIQQGTAEISVNNLHHYKDHKYSLYKGERFTEMVESIKAHGILTPLIVRPINTAVPRMVDDLSSSFSLEAWDKRLDKIDHSKENCPIDYEILAGHNRYECAKAAGFETVPCIIKEDLTDIEAKIIVHVTNANQRSLEAYSHSERAAIIADYHEAMKQQGKRNDLLKAIDEELELTEKVEKPQENQTAIEKFGLSKNTIARYVRIDKLIPDFKELLDEDKISIGTGVELSHIDHDNQMILYNYITENGYALDIKQAKSVRQLFTDNGSLTPETLKTIFSGKENIQKTPKNIAISRNKLKTYFSDDEPIENIENTVITALEFYFNHKERTQNE